MGFVEDGIEVTSLVAGQKGGAFFKGGEHAGEAYREKL